MAVICRVRLHRDVVVKQGGTATHTDIQGCAGTAAQTLLSTQQVQKEGDTLKDVSQGKGGATCKTSGPKPL